MTREQALEFKEIYKARIRCFKETMNDENRIFNRAMIDVNQRCLSVVNKVLAYMDCNVLAICPECGKTDKHTVLQSTELEDVLECLFCNHIFTIRYGRVAV